jgi:hypothetical protein
MGLDKKDRPDSLSGDWQKAFPPAPGKTPHASDVAGRPGSSMAQPTNVLDEDAQRASSRDHGAWTPPTVTRLPIGAKSKGLQPA